MTPAPVTEVPALAPTTNWCVRFYEPRDRQVVRRICADTGFLGSPIDPVFEDRELFADYLTRYYTDVEPRSTLVVEVEGEVKGYLMGSRQVMAHQWYRFWSNTLLLGRGLWSYFMKPYQASTRRYVHWLLTRSVAESPKTPRGTPHFHINLLPEARSVAQTRAIIDRFLLYLVEHGESSVYGQIVTFDKRRGVRMFERYGFKVVDQVEVTKYQWLKPEPVFLFTVIKDLAANGRLYGHDLAKRASR
jgi:hypothetical protein